jgi:MinD-like ATPase involved in chromosome partitioning or flagellar assembly
MDRLAEVLMLVKDAYDFILIDGAAGIGREVISVIKASDNVLLVANPEMTSVLAAVKALKISRALGVPAIGVVLNRAMKEKHALKQADIEELCESKVIGVIPFDKKVQESIKKMEPVALSDRSSPAKEAFIALGSYLLGVEYRREGLLERLKRLFRLRVL